MDIEHLAKRERAKHSKLMFTPALVDAICERIAAGETWTNISREPEMPSYQSLYNWRRAMPKVEEAVCQAMEIAGDARFEAMMGVFDETTPATVTADRLEIDVLKYQAEKLAPRRFGKAADPLEAKTYVGTVYEQDPVTGEVTATTPE